ncbi:MAG TPA: alpha/beta hydrolase [Pseudonocardiaceae bacterium]
MYVEFGGRGPGILLLHGLMGRATTWWRVARWLTRYGRVVGLDARGHGRNPRPARGARTEDFVADAAAAVERLDLAPVVVIGHSMGGLHAWGLAAERPDLVRAVVVEDMAPDWRGHTADGWLAWFDSWPVPFRSLAHVREFFGAEHPEIGDYFAECVEERADGYHLIADPAELVGIAQEWGERAYWDLVERVHRPLLAVEAGAGFLPPGQLAELARRVPGGGRHLVVPGAGHLVHDSAPHVFRGAVEAFLAEVLGR